MKEIGTCPRCKFPVYDNVTHYSRNNRVYHVLCGGRIPGAVKVPPKRV